MHIVIMAGGAGIRFWPASRKEKPKQFLHISGPKPMVVETVERVQPLAADEEMMIVLGRDHRVEMQRLLPDRRIHILAEPQSRNTAPCMGLAALYASYLKWHAPLVFLAADHFIGNAAAFRAGLERAVEAAADGAIVTLGIVPAWPETGYGYIQRSDEKQNATGADVFRAKKFIEKPGLPQALEYVRSKEFFWNAGIFIAKPETILKAIERCLPNLSSRLMRLADCLGTPRFERVLEEVYGEIESISFDYGVMEHTDLPVLIVPCECGWSDVGSWAALYALKAALYDEHKNLLEGNVVVLDSQNNFISSRNDKLIACLGLDHCLIVDTPESLLVMDLNRAQEIRKLIDKIEASGKEEKL